MNWTRAILTLVVALLAVTAVSAQTGGMVVRVVDSNGPLPGATVTISHDTGYVKTTSVLTSPDGVAEFPVLRPGDGYSIEVSFPGFGTRRMPDLRVKIGQSETFTVQLAEEHTERVKVTAESDVVDLEDTGQTTKFSDEFIQDLPVPGRFYQNVLTLAPGVQDTDGDGNPNVHGARERDFQTVVSGISNVDPLTGGYMSEVNPNSIEEIEVITAGAGAEFSRAQGGFARIIQTQGNNEFEGVFEFFYRSDLLDGTGAHDSSDRPAPEFESITPGITVSGPIVKDKLWYRLSHQWTKRQDPLALGTGIVTTDIERSTHSDRLTWQVSPRNKLDFDFQSDPLQVEGLGINAFTPKESSRFYERTGESYSLTWTAPFSPKILIESQVAWQDLNTKLTPVVAGLKNDCLGDEPLTGGNEFLRDAYCTNLVTAGRSGSFNRTEDDHRQRLTTRGDATIYGGRFWGMTHEFKVGFKTENERYFRDLSVLPGFGYFKATPQTDPGDPEPDLESTAYMFTNISVPEQTDITATGTIWGLYAQDQIKPLQNLTITLGIRVDREELNSSSMSQMYLDQEAATSLAMIESGVEPFSVFPQTLTSYEDWANFVSGIEEQTGKDVSANLAPAARQSQFWQNTRVPTNLNITNTNWAPRFSIAWDPWSNGKTKFAASAGRYYNNIPLAIPLIELEPISTQVIYEAAIDSQGNLGEPDLSGSFNAAANGFSVDPNLKTPYNDEFTLSFERELWAETSISVSYINRKFRDQFQDIDLNFLPGDYGRCQIQTNASQARVIPSPGSGQTLIDPYTGISYIDTDPGDGDGFVTPGFTQPYDDCAGEQIVDPTGGDGSAPGPSATSREIADNVPDLYRQNPGWGSVYWVSNLNRMDYEGIVLELTRRQYRSWEFQASYTFSKSTGDGEDFNSFVGDDQSQIIDAGGYQNYDQRHVVKMQATTITPWGFRLGGSVLWQSGLPYSQFRSGVSLDQSIPAYGSLGDGADTRFRTLYTDGERNNFRNVPYWTVNAKLTKELNLGRGLNMQLSAEIYNLLNDGTYFINTAQVNGRNNDFFNFGRQWMLSMRLAF